MATSQSYGVYPLHAADSSDEEWQSTGDGINPCFAAAQLSACASRFTTRQGLPFMKGEMAWKPEELADPLRYTYKLSAAEVLELEHGLDVFKEFGLDGDLITCHNFPLPTLGARLHALARELHDGKGFFVLRGLDPERYTPEDNLLLFLGIAGYIGQRRGRQNLFTRAMVTHIFDQKRLSLPSAHLNSKDGIEFHNDQICDILALQTRRCAARGGSTMIASAWTVYNDLLSSRSGIIPILCRPDWPFWSPYRDPPYDLRPLLFHLDGKLIMSVDPGRLGPQSGYPTDAVPELSRIQAEALDAVIATAKRHQIRIATQPGDILFVNNFSMLHAREAFRNDTGEGRHLVRLWLRNDNLGWPLPAPLRTSWNMSFAYDDKLQDSYPIEPQLLDTLPSYYLYSGSH